MLKRKHGEVKLEVTDQNPIENKECIFPIVHINERYRQVELQLICHESNALRLCKRQVCCIKRLWKS